MNPKKRLFVWEVGYVKRLSVASLSGSFQVKLSVLSVVSSVVRTY